MMRLFGARARCLLKSASTQLAALAVLLVALPGCGAFAAVRVDVRVPEERWRSEARDTTIVRDDWGIAHIHGRSDADAIFGMAYAQAEDDFQRVEMNYINALGRLAEVEGSGALYQDLRMKLFIDPQDLKRDYSKNPPWLQRLMVAWADGLNFYLHTHPQVTPRVIHHFEPWMALSFSEGSIGPDIERAALGPLQSFYGEGAPPSKIAELSEPLQEPKGSNGFAIAPANTLNHHALLLINPHTSFYFRSELQVTSEEGLNAYGAVTWGQFFIYQGFNQRTGWMHTSSGVDAVDEYLETVEKKGDHFTYKYGNQQRSITAEQITVPYKTDHGVAEK